VRGAYLVGANLATHPIIYFLFPAIGAGLSVAWRDTYLVSELFAPLVEATILVFGARISAKIAFPAMFLANLSSWAIGAMLFR
jgi:hypothetical protein